MIYTLNYPHHELERVNQVIYDFIRNSIPNCEYSRDLVPLWFREVLSNSKSKEGFKSFEDKFKDVHKAFQAIDINIRQSIFNLFDDGIDIRSLCDQPTKDIVLTANYPNLHEKLKILIKEHFFSIALSTNKTLETKLNTTLKKHYIEFKVKNREGRVCPFCGIHEYGLVEGESKDDYDHWLYKEKYPLYAVNFANLVPMCDKCNDTGVKGTEDVLHDKITGVRRASFYPYETNLGVNISVINYLPVENLTDDQKDKFPYGYFNLNILHNSIAEADKVMTWKTVFKIGTRFNSYLSECYLFNKDDFHDYYLVNHPEIVLDNDLINLRNVLVGFRNQLGNPKRKTAVEINKAYLDFICLPENAHFLYTFCNINLMDYA
jgi:hypothetical protein